MNEMRRLTAGAFDQQVAMTFSSPADARQRYGFRLGDLGFLIPEDCPGEIIRNSRVCSLPFTKNWLKGVFNHRGSLIPLFDLRQMLLQDPLPLEKSPLLILGKGHHAIAIVMESAPQMLTSLQPAISSGSDIPKPLVGQITDMYLSDSGQLWLSFKPGDFFTFLADNAKLC